MIHKSWFLILGNIIQDTLYYKLDLAINSSRYHRYHKWKHLSKLHNFQYTHHKYLQQNFRNIQLLNKCYDIRRFINGSNQHYTLSKKPQQNLYKQNKRHCMIHKSWQQNFRIIQGDMLYHKKLDLVINSSQYRKIDNLKFQYLYK